MLPEQKEGTEGRTLENMKDEELLFKIVLKRNLENMLINRG